MKRSLFLSPLPAGLVISSLLASCGGDKSTPTGPGPGPSPTPSGSFHTVLIPTVGFVLNPGTAMFRNIDFPPAGTIDVTVDWQGTSDINVYATEQCVSFTDLQAGACKVLAKSESATAKPEVIFFQTVANRVYNVWVHNKGTSKETGGVQVGITTSQPYTPPTPDPNSTNPNLAAGPVVRSRLYIYAQRHSDGNYEDKTQDAAGRWVLHVGDFVVFDTSQYNANGELCQYNAPPKYFLEDPQGVLRVLGSSQPFLYRTDVIAKGEISMYSTIDGINSNNLRAIAIAK